MSNRKPNYKSAEKILHLYILLYQRSNKYSAVLLDPTLMGRLGISRTTLKRYQKVVAKATRKKVIKKLLSGL